MGSSRKRRVLYFTIGTFAPTPYVLGGNIYGKNLVRRLIEDEGIELFVVNANQEAHRAETEAFFRENGVPLRFVALRSSPRSRSVLEFLARHFGAAFRFPYEMEARGQDHVAAAAGAAIKDWRIEHVLVDYLPAVLFWKAVRQMAVPKALVTVNREAELYRDPYTHKGWRAWVRGWRAWVSHRRLARFERQTYCAFDKVVAIGAPDAPGYLPASRKAIVTSYLDPSPSRWVPGADNTIFFVGNYGHYPNRLAIDHIVSEIAPRTLARFPAASFAIIGASPDQINPAFHHPSVHLLGVSTPEEVQRLFLRAALFICPVENTFGIKFKVAEAISYGTPFLASRQTMLGFPYLEGIPELRLDDPEHSASAISALLSDPRRLHELSVEISRRQAAFAASQKNIWSRTLFG